MQATVNDGDVVFDVQNRLLLEPMQELASVGGGEHRLQGVIDRHMKASRRNLQEVKVMIAEHGARTDRTQPPQHAERIMAAVDEIPNAKELVPGTHPQLQQKAIELDLAALDVAHENSPFPLHSYARA